MVLKTIFSPHAFGKIDKRESFPIAGSKVLGPALRALFWSAGCTSNMTVASCRQHPGLGAPACLAAAPPDLNIASSCLCPALLHSSAAFDDPRRRGMAGSRVEVGDLGVHSSNCDLVSPEVTVADPRPCLNECSAVLYKKAYGIIEEPIRPSGITHVYEPR